MINTIVHYVNFYYPTLKNLTYSENVIKTALIYRFLYETTFKKHISLETIIYKLENKSIKSNNRVLNNHYKVGRGCVYVFDSPIKSEVLGYLTGICYWIFHKGLI